MTANERHFKRDAILSQKHRTWGYNVPAMDIDFLLCEFDNLIPVALIDYRHLNGTVDLQSVGARVLAKLGDMAGLPAFIVQYWYLDAATGQPYDGLWHQASVTDEAEFLVFPLNSKAEQIHQSWACHTEQQYKAWLHQIRGR